MSSDTGVGTNQQTQQTQRIGDEVAEHLSRIVKAPVPRDEDLFASGLVPSVVAMELIVHLEATYGIAITGPDLKLANFRTVERISALVQRLREQPA
ncbi:acyl carrier protein [Kineosporia rhizophila]|uniref:acyl carrier protein n=1 Tax=Kineosporia rhizophila TaxID=84633 RepID=UPI001E29C687|nr:acyl carrier protein [Kineosporia sp. NBRC 101677]MCE0536187.1 acyl carrier protein [Kineosporia rhizophila]GLY15235.1 hypothetical protein Kisp01_22500 [Kineosporia sp. NBRC 101677]